MPCLLTILALAAGLVGFEDSKVLPKGVRNLDVRGVNTDISEKTNGAGGRQPLAKPLAQDLTFAKIAKDQEAFKAASLRAFLPSNGFSESDVVGTFSADLNGHLSVWAPIFAYGVSEKLTIALAVPIYKAETSLSVGFKPNATGAAFLAALNDPKNNQRGSALDAAHDLNNAVGKLNSKLADNGYRQLGDWNAQGLGDVTLAGKYRFFETSPAALATTAGVVAPTGRQDDPDILTDIAFGDGQWDVYDQLSLDEPLRNGFFLNQNVKYTEQLPARKTVRDATKDEPIVADTSRARFKLGDKVDAGTSLQWQPPSGLLSGLGYTYFRKFGDVYRDLPLASKALLEDGTDQEAHNAEAILGYSTVPAYLRGSFAVPFDLRLSYTKQLRSRNMPVSDLAQVDFNMYF